MIRNLTFPTTGTGIFDAKTGSFVSRDPLGLAVGNKVYSYGDPLGLCKGGLGDSSTSLWLDEPRVGIRSHLDTYRGGGSYPDPENALTILKPKILPA